MNNHMLGEYKSEGNKAQIILGIKGKTRLSSRKRYADLKITIINQEKQ